MKGAHPKLQILMFSIRMVVIGTYFKLLLTEIDPTNINYFMDITFTLQLVNTFYYCPLEHSNILFIYLIAINFQYFPAQQK